MMPALIKKQAKSYYFNTTIKFNVVELKMVKTNTLFNLIFIFSKAKLYSVLKLVFYDKYHIK